MNPAASKESRVRLVSSVSSVVTCSSQRDFSPPSLPSSLSAAFSWSSAFLRLSFKASASPVRLLNSFLRSTTCLSRSTRSCLHCAIRVRDVSRDSESSLRSSSRGAIFSSTEEYLRFALAHAASGAAATDARRMFLCSKEAALSSISF